jgi:hypothetical protein
MNEFKQNYYAQCQGCSQVQSVLMRHGKRTALRLHKVWMLSPGAIPGELPAVMLLYNMPLSHDTWYDVIFYTTEIETWKKKD